MSAMDIVEKLTSWSTRAKRGERRLILEARAEIRSLRMLLNAEQSEHKRLQRQIRLLAQDNERFRQEIADRDQIVTK